MALSETLAQAIAIQRRVLGRRILVGLAGAQGSGKSTLSTALMQCLAAEGLGAVVLALDDFYLTRTERLALANEVHPLLATRGPPGTHDLGLMQEVVDGLLSGETVCAPVFDKASDDRAGMREVASPADVILLEGWCVGATPQPLHELAEPINALERDQDRDRVWRAFVNDALKDYQSVFGRIDLLIQLCAPSFEIVAAWRWEQEVKLRARTPGGQTMDETGVRRFVQHYERITRHMLAEMPGRADVVVELDSLRRSVVSKPVHGGES